MRIVPVDPSLEPAGHYSQLVESGGLYFMSGQLPSGVDVQATAEEQFDAVMQRIVRILAAGDLDLSHVIKTTVFISDVGYWPVINERYASCFGAHKPARSVVPVVGLHYGYKVEIELIAEKR